MTNSRKQRRQAAERRRLRALTAGAAAGSAGLTEADATTLIASAETKHTH